MAAKRGNKHKRESYCTPNLSLFLFLLFCAPLRVLCGESAFHYNRLVHRRGRRVNAEEFGRSYLEKHI